MSNAVNIILKVTLIKESKVYYYKIILYSVQIVLKFSQYKLFSKNYKIMEEGTKNQITNYHC